MKILNINESWIHRSNFDINLEERSHVKGWAASQTSRSSFRADRMTVASCGDARPKLKPNHISSLGRRYKLQKMKSTEGINSDVRTNGTVVESRRTLQTAKCSSFQWHRESTILLFLLQRRVESIEWQAWRPAQRMKATWKELCTWSRAAAKLPREKQQL